MDIVTQGLLGASMAAAAAPREQLRAAAVCGFASGLLADADVLIRSPDDALLVLEYHRHFSHALAFVPFGALVAAALLWPAMRRRLPFARIYLYALLGYALSGVLDACTSYGTSLLWPFADTRIAWSVVAVVDPVFSLALLVALALALRRRHASSARIGLALAAAYLVAGAVQHDRARDVLAALAAGRGHTPERIVVKPTLGNLVLWRGLYLAHGQVQAAALRVGAVVSVHPGDSAPLAAATGATGATGDGPLARFAVLSDGWLIDDPRHPGRIGDARYSMLPTALRPLWGIERDDSGVVRLVTDRTMSNAERGRFLDLLLGRTPRD
jgi:inner membrane protein